MPASCRLPVLHCARPFPLPQQCCRVGRQDPNAGNSRVAECRSQTVREHDFWHSRSSQEHADRLARCDLLLVFYSRRTQTITSRLCSPNIPQEDTSSSAFDRRTDSATADGLYVINAWSVLRESICSSVSISRYFVDVGTLRAIVFGTVRLASVVKVENPRQGNSIFSVGSPSHEGRAHQMLMRVNIRYHNYLPATSNSRQLFCTQMLSFGRIQPFLQRSTYRSCVFLRTFRCRIAICQ